MAKTDDQATQTAEPQAEATLPAESSGPGSIVVEVRKQKKGKKKYARGLKRPAKLGESMTRASERVARAVASGLRLYRKRSDRSARRRRDGAVRDVVRNAARGISRVMARSAKAPLDVGKRAPRLLRRRDLRRLGRLSRRTVKALGLPARLLAR